MDIDQTLSFAQDLARLRREGRSLRRRIEERCELTSVLIADDDPVMCALLSATLSPENYEVLETNNGAGALALIAEHQPSLVVLDARMPEPDGFEVCTRVKAGPAPQDILVIMLTANPADEPRALAAGADRYLSKPFSPLQLLKLIEVMLLER